MAVKRIDHIGVAVSDLEGAFAFLTDVLGMEPDGQRVPLPEQHVDVQFAQCGDGKIELIAPTNEESPISRRIAKRGEGLLHICLEVDNIHAEFERLSKLGVRFAEPAPWMSPHGWAVFLHPQSWRGISIELREFLKA
jgi:methylmalonyl-CoA/ethylmalonyl-CoA epimerase